ncbi:MAG: vitamin K epoxide reductase family protein [Deltaproteobacteria bacterium]|nr:vitamin K epoxide reductase family protein [Deltaproteobacteria bacterium]
MTGLQKEKKWFLAIVVTAALGIAVCIYLTHIHFKVHTGDDAYSSICNINAEYNCDAVAASEWSIFFGIPVSLWGLLFYLGCLGFSLVKLLTKKLQNLSVYLCWGGGCAVGFSVCLAYISKVMLDTWCLFCMASWLLTLLVFVFSILACTLPVIKHFAVFKQGALWVLQRPLRMIAEVVLVALFVSLVGFAWSE